MEFWQCCIDMGCETEVNSSVDLYKTPAFSRLIGAVENVGVLNAFRDKILSVKAGFPQIFIAHSSQVCYTDSNTCSKTINPSDRPLKKGMV